MAVDPQKLDSQKAAVGLPYDANNQKFLAIMLPVVDPNTSEITGWVPIAYELDENGYAVIKVKVVV